MRIYEEYLNRHSITDVPVIHHCQNAAFVVKFNDKESWHDFASVSEDFVRNSTPFAVFQISWISANVRPGEYMLSLKSPIHDAFGSSGYFNNIFSERVKWHNYETALISICDRLSGSLIYDQGLDLIMALWEMFVYSHDSWFCRQGGDIKYILYQTLDKDIQIAHRASCIQEMLRKLGNVNANLVKVWRNEYLCYTQTETMWFIRLVKQPCPKTILQLS